MLDLVNIFMFMSSDVSTKYEFSELSFVQNMQVVIDINPVRDLNFLFVAAVPGVVRSCPPRMCVPVMSIVLILVTAVKTTHHSARQTLSLLSSRTTTSLSTA